MHNERSRKQEEEKTHYVAIAPDHATLSHFLSLSSLLHSQSLVSENSFLTISFHLLLHPPIMSVSSIMWVHKATAGTASNSPVIEARLYNAPETSPQLNQVISLNRWIKLLCSITTTQFVR